MTRLSPLPDATRRVIRPELITETWKGTTVAADPALVVNDPPVITPDDIRERVAALLPDASDKVRDDAAHVLAALLNGSHPTPTDALAALCGVGMLAADDAEAVAALTSDPTLETDWALWDDIHADRTTTADPGRPATADRVAAPNRFRPITGLCGNPRECDACQSGVGHTVADAEALTAMYDRLNGWNLPTLIGTDFYSWEQVARVDGTASDDSGMPIYDTDAARPTALTAHDVWGDSVTGNARKARRWIGTAQGSMSHKVGPKVWPNTRRPIRNRPTLADTLTARLWTVDLAGSVTCETFLPSRYRIAEPTPRRVGTLSSGVKRGRVTYRYDIGSRRWIADHRTPTVRTVRRERPQYVTVSDVRTVDYTVGTRVTDDTGAKVSVSDAAPRSGIPRVKVTIIRADGKRITRTDVATRVPVIVAARVA